MCGCQRQDVDQNLQKHEDSEIENDRGGGEKERAEEQEVMAFVGSRSKRHASPKPFPYST